MDDNGWPKLHKRHRPLRAAIIPYAGIVANDILLNRQTALLYSPPGHCLSRLAHHIEAKMAGVAVSRFVTKSIGAMVDAEY